jgi:hypothetical protein
MWGRRGMHTALVGKSEGNRPLGDVCVDGWLILKWIVNR